MTSVDFKCKCPCVKCKGNGPVIQWVCPDCKCKKLFDDTAKIICSGCGNLFPEKSHYIWKARFKCYNGDELYHEISYQGMLATLSAMGSINNPPTGFIKKITKQCLLHEDDFLQE